MQIAFNNINIKNTCKSANLGSNPIKALHKPNKKGLMLGLMMLASANIAGLAANKGANLYAQTQKTPVEYINNYFGKYGNYYSENIPDIENAQEHADSLKQIRSLYKEIQGCDFNNPAILNGLSADELKQKVLVPAQKLAKGETFGKNQNTLVFMIFDNACDKNNAFERDLKKNTFNANNDSLDNFKFTFEEAFLSHYDNIILVQPNNGQSADKTLDTVFKKLEKCLDNTAKTDIIFEGHGVNRKGVRLSPDKSNETSMMDLSDFNSVSGNEYANSMKNIFINSINSGYSPKIIGIGCSSDFMQDAVDMIMPSEYKNKVKVFGTPYDTMQSASIGYNNGCLEMITYTMPIKNNKGFLIKLTDGNWKKANDKCVESFMINPDKKVDNNMFTINQYFTDGIKSGSLSKDSGVVMQYFVRDFSNKNIVR